MKTIKKNIPISFLGNTIYCDIVKAKYQNNDRLYLGLIESDSKELFSDITINDPEIELKDNEILIDHDFRNLVFNNKDYWIFDFLKENLKAKSYILQGYMKVQL